MGKYKTLIAFILSVFFTIQITKFFVDSYIESYENSKMISISGNIDSNIFPVLAKGDDGTLFLLEGKEFTIKVDSCVSNINFKNMDSTVTLPVSSWMEVKLKRGP